jgi:hypothetical protein
MSTFRKPRLSRRSVERMLEHPAGTDPLSRLLSSAAAPAADVNLEAETRALAAFRAQGANPAIAHRRRSLVKSALAKLVAARLITLTAVAGAATGGLALAAATGTLPPSIQNFAHNTVNAPADHGKHGPVPSGTGSSTGSAAVTEATVAAPSLGSSPSASHSAASTPSPSLRGLCTAYLAGATSNPGKAASNPAFTALITAAGGVENVAAFCAALIPTPSASSTGVSSSHPGNAPSTHPNGAPSTHPTGAPSTHPGGGNTTHPTGPPSSHPGKP